MINLSNWNAIKFKPIELHQLTQTQDLANPDYSVDCLDWLFVYFVFCFFVMTVGAAVDSQSSFPFPNLQSPCVVCLVIDQLYRSIDI